MDWGQDEGEAASAMAVRGRAVRARTHASVGGASPILRFSGDVEK